MKVFAISDLHLSTAVDKPMDIFGEAWADYFNRIEQNWRARVGEDDIVLIAGDISWAMNLADALPDLKLINGLPGYKVIIRGNHDYWWKSITQIRQALPDNFFAVQNDCIRIGSYLICGSRGWTTPEGSAQADSDKKIYARETERLKLSLGMLSKMRSEGDTAICMLHYPPFNSRREPSDFTWLISEHNIDSVVYGHLHGKDCRADKLVNLNGIKYYLTSCDIVNNSLVEIY